MKGRPVETITIDDTTNQQKENPHNVNSNKATYVDSVIKKYAQSHEQRLHRHINVEALQLLNNDGLVRRLNRRKPFQLV
jgi:hypothetical protein